MPTMRPVPPAHISVSRGDPVYSAHAYLTKVPVTAIRPFIETFTEPGETVLDPFAGSGMTGVAAAMSGRRARLRDINELGRHVGTNYLNLVDPARFRDAVNFVIETTTGTVGDVYQTQCGACGRGAQLSRTIWSGVWRCGNCDAPVNYYHALEAAGWSKSRMSCGACNGPFNLRTSNRIGEAAVLDTIACDCRRKLHDQPHTPPMVPANPSEVSAPDVSIGADRQMFRASALAKNKLTSTASFFSPRNLAVLAALREAIAQQPDEQLRNKLLFAFTAILARASKRYQWSRQRPLNAAHQHYYIAPVFYEWNVLDLFVRKADALIKSDAAIRTELQRGWFLYGTSPQTTPDVHYEIGSADKLDLPDESIDYVFTDPPFGSNIFYSDMSLFQEAWLGRTTNHEAEAVVDRAAIAGVEQRSAERYERLITDALRECNRVLKTGGWLSLVFSNSSGSIWALVQRAVMESGFTIDADHITVLDKGQRSVKGLASGFENVVTIDLVLSMQKRDGMRGRSITEAPASFVDDAVQRVFSRVDPAPTPSHIYLGVVREYLRAGYDLSGLDLSRITAHVRHLGYEVDQSKGTIRLGRDQ